MKKNKAIEQEHPYYDSNRKKATESFALKMIFWTGLVVFILCLILK